MRVTNEKNEEIGKINKSYSGEDFNKIYASYASDKALVTYIAENSEDIPVAVVEQMPENLENEPLPVEKIIV